MWDSHSGFRADNGCQRQGVNEGPEQSSSQETNMKNILALIIAISVSTVSCSTVFAQTETDTTVLTEADRLHADAQKICPVSGQQLGSQGEPVKIQAGEQIAFLCCRECLEQKITTEHWQTVQENIANTQGVCPVTEMPVDSSMDSVVINGRQVFVCCPDCIENVQADAKGTLAKVEASYAAFVAAERQAESDRHHIAAQKICPVSGEELGSRGVPFKIQVGEEHAFLCCAECQQQKLDATHWAAIQANLVSVQAICPVTHQPVDGRSESTVAGGRRIFVCCSDCVETIQADPGAYVEKLNLQISATTPLPAFDFESMEEELDAGATGRQ